MSDFKLQTAVLLAFTLCAFAQESPTPTPSASPIPTAPPTRSARISFLPPPMEGTISLGIYDQNGQLVRVLHQEAELGEFTVGADALETKWDGKNDDGEELPAGKYHARGYSVGHLKLEEIGKTGPSSDASATVQVKLMANPLAKNAKTIVDLAVGFDDQNSYLRTQDGLPLFTISEKPNVVRALISKSGEKSVDIWQDDGTETTQDRISNIDKMIGFDCGEFELK